MQKLEALFTPLQVRGLLIENRLVMAPMHTGLGAGDGTATRRLVDYYSSRARGGVGLIIQEATSVLRNGSGGLNWLGIWDDATIPGWRDLVSAVHDCGAKIAIQLHHGGGESSARFTGTEPVVPWAWTWREPTHILTMAEIVALEDAFVEATERAVAAGYDLIELHGAHGYLINQFLSPLSNRRPDEYGGDLDGRLRFACNVIAKVRRVVGPDFPLSIRISADEFLPGGMTLEESQRAAPKLVQAGADTVNVSGGRGSAATYLTVAPMEIPHGNLLHLAAGIKQVVDVPVIAVGRITDPRMAEDILRTGKADLVAMGRALIADPELPKKAREGRLDDIRPCIGCHQGCRRESGRYLLGNLTCLSNPEVGHEGEHHLDKAATPQKVVVIGGGPAGLEAARIAALRGHRVTLFEQESNLGGRLRAGTVAPGKQDVGALIAHLAGQAKKLGVEIRCGEGATKDSVQAAGADAVILAVGGEPVVPDLPGVERAVLAEDVLLGRIAVGQRVVVMGGGMTGCEVAEHLAAQSRQVTLVTRIERQQDMASDLPRSRKPLLFGRLAELGVQILMATALEAVEEGAVLVRHGEERVRLPADSVVLAQGYRANAKLAEHIAALGLPLRVVGDAKECRTAKEAILEGSEAGRTVGAWLVN